MFFAGLRRWCAREAAAQFTRRSGKHRRNWRLALEPLESRQVLTGSPIDVWPGMDYEGDSGSKFLEFQVSLTEPITQPVDVAYETSDLDFFTRAEAGSDYAATSGTLHFEPGGLTAQVVQVEIFGDMRWESDEQFLMTFTPSDGSGSVLSEGFIANDDGVPQVAISDATVVEGTAEEFGFAEFTITRTGAIGDPLNLAYETVFDTADSEDLPYTGEFITMEAGEASRTVLIPIYGDDSAEPSETFFVNLYSWDLVEITDNQGLGTILDDDSSLVVTVGNPSFLEKDTGITSGFFTVELHETQLEAVAVHVRTIDGTATGGSDYSPIDQDIVFAPGETVKQVPISIYSDLEIEGNEGFTIEVNSILGAPLATGTAVIVDNDYVNHPPVVSQGPYLASEWTTFELYFPSQIDPDQPNSTLQYELDLDYDGVTFEGGPLIPINPAALGWDGPSSHTIALRVTDEKGAVSNIATTTVDVFNEAPLATVGPDITVDEGTTVSAPAQYFDVDPLTFRWHLVSTTSGQSIPDQTTPELEFVADAGSYTFEFTATDDEGASSFTKLLIVTARNIRPSVSVGPSQTVLEGSTVTMSSTVQAPSTDTLTYNWQQNNTNDQLFPLPDAPSFDFVPIDNGEYYFALNVWDDEDTFDTDLVLVTVLNAPPVVDAGADRTVLEGSPVTLSGSATDPGLDTLSYQWRLVSSSNGQTIADQETADLEFTPADQGTYVFELTVSDDDGGSSTDSIVVTVTNALPTASISGAANGVAGQTISFQVGGDDASADLAAGFIYQIDWGDGSAVESLTGGSSVVPLSHVYTDTGNYVVQVTATDKDSGQSAAATQNVDIANTLISGGILYVGGSNGNDTISINDDGASGNVGVTINGVDQGTFSVAVRVVVYGGAGNDTIAVQQKIVLDAWLFGGAGNDVLTSARGNDVLSGGAGADVLSSDRGRDLLFGGAGLDVLAAGQDDDILVSGTSSYETDESALAAIMAEWTAPRDFVTRQRNLQDGSGSSDRLNDQYFLQLGQTVLDDEQNDSSSGGGGTNWTL